MPRCKRCNQEHYNFQTCPEPQAPVGMAGDNPWGTPFSRSPVAFRDAKGRELRTQQGAGVYAHPVRLRTGSISTPPEWEPPEAA